ncbi:MAG: preprotein translocase subunit SecE [Chitinophagales bacterium]|nr:preprotein translocase subunit SecE [Chitinophagales bacterium]
MDKFTLYFREAYQELLHKVSWPTFKELQSSASIVLVAAVIIAAVIALIDLGSKNLLKVLYDQLW